MNIVICDDTEKDANLLRLYINKYFGEINCPVNILSYSSGDAFLKDFAAKQIGDVKIAFIDILMPGTDGIDTAKRIREIDKDMTIVFTTVSKKHSLEGYSVYALQYFVKPINYTDIKELFEKCTDKFADSLRFIDVLSDRLTVRAYLKDICYIESFGDALHIHTVTETVKTFLPLSELENQIDSSTFLRTQRSYIVNMQHIDDMTADGFIMQNGKGIPIRRNDKSAIKQAYRDYLSALTLGGLK